MDQSTISDMYETNGFKLFSEKCTCVRMKNGTGENNCFVNSLIHLFNYIPELLTYITNPKYQSKFKISPLFIQLSLLMTKYKEIHSSDGSCYNNIIIDPIGLREEIAKFFKQEGLYQKGQQGDPIELLIFFLQSFHSISFPNCNKFLKENENKCDPRCLSHLLFHIGLEEVKECQKCHNKVITPYHTNYFIYEIYIKEVFQYLEKEDTSNRFQKNFEKLFILSKKAMEYVEYPCDKCKNKISTKKLNCDANGKYLIVQTSDLSHNVSMEQVCQSYFLIPKRVNSEDIFFIEKKGIKKTYNLFGLILYWNKHYLSVFYDKDLKKYVLYDDMTVLTFEGWDALIPYLLKNHYCPIALFYRELDSETSSKSFRLSQSLYDEMMSFCKTADQQRVKNDIDIELSNKLKEDEWRCNYCSFINILSTYICKSCGKSDDKIYELLKKTKEVEKENQGKSQREEKKEERQNVENQNENEINIKDSKIISNDEKWSCLCGNVNPSNTNRCLKCNSIKINIHKWGVSPRKDKERDIYNKETSKNREDQITNSLYNNKKIISQSTITNSSQTENDIIKKPSVGKSPYLSQSIVNGGSFNMPKEYEISGDMLNAESTKRNLFDSKIGVEKENQKPKIKQDEWSCDFCETVNKKSAYICPNCRCINEDLQSKSFNFINNYYH